MPLLDILKAIGPYASAGAEVAGGLGKGRAAGRAAEATTQGQYDQNALLRYASEQRARSEAAQLAEQMTQDRANRALTSGADRARQVALGDVMANMQPVSISGMSADIPVVKFGGGLSPAALGPAARASGRTLAHDALLAQLTGSDVPGRGDLSGLGGAAPRLHDLPQSGKLDTILNAISTGGSIAGIPGAVQQDQQTLSTLKSIQDLLNQRSDIRTTRPTPQAGTGRTPLSTPTDVEAFLNRPGANG